MATSVNCTIIIAICGQNPHVSWSQNKNVSSATESEGGGVQSLSKEQTEAAQTAAIETPFHGAHSQTYSSNEGQLVQWVEEQ